MTEVYERERKKIDKIKGMISRRWLVFCNTQYSLTYPVFVSNFKIKLCSSCEIFDKTFHIHYNEVRGRKEGKEKEG